MSTGGRVSRKTPETTATPLWSRPRACRRGLKSQRRSPGAFRVTMPSALPISRSRADDPGEVINSRGDAHSPIRAHPEKAERLEDLIDGIL